MSAPEQQAQPQQDLSPENLCKMLEQELEKNEKVIENCNKQCESLKASIAKLKA